MDYYRKYLKYKAKYLELRNQMYGGVELSAAELSSLYEKRGETFKLLNEKFTALNHIIKENPTKINNSEKEKFEKYIKIDTISTKIKVFNNFKKPILQETYNSTNPKEDYDKIKKITDDIFGKLEPLRKELEKDELAKYIKDITFYIMTPKIERKTMLEGELAKDPGSTIYQGRITDEEIYINFYKTLIEIINIIKEILELDIKIYEAEITNINNILANVRYKQFIDNSIRYKTIQNLLNPENFNKKTEEEKNQILTDVIQLIIQKLPPKTTLKDLLGINDDRVFSNITTIVGALDLTLLEQIFRGKPKDPDKNLFIGIRNSNNKAILISFMTILSKIFSNDASIKEEINKLNIIK